MNFQLPLINFAIQFSNLVIKPLDFSIEQAVTLPCKLDRIL